MRAVAMNIKTVMNIVEYALVAVAITATPASGAELVFLCAPARFLRRPMSMPSVRCLSRP
jgi:hypothetical protein